MTWKSKPWAVASVDYNDSGHLYSTSVAYSDGLSFFATRAEAVKEACRRYANGYRGSQAILQIAALLEPKPVAISQFNVEEAE